MEELDENVRYKCTKCKTEEDIPIAVVIQFDLMDTSNIEEPPCFNCEKCGAVMRPLFYEGVHGRVYKWDGK